MVAFNNIVIAVYLNTTLFIAVNRISHDTTIGANPDTTNITDVILIIKACCVALY